MINLIIIRVHRERLISVSLFLKKRILYVDSLITALI